MDGIISAEIPPPTDPLHNVVKRLMVHGPCGANYRREDLSCCKNSTEGKCKYKYPRLSTMRHTWMRGVLGCTDEGLQQKEDMLSRNESK